MVVIYIVSSHVKLIILKFIFYIYFEYLDVHVISFAFVGLLICTYLSWSNYHLAHKCDPGFIPINPDQQNRVK
jgi:hypothetical protein